MKYIFSYKKLWKWLSEYILTNIERRMKSYFIILVEMFLFLPISKKFNKINNYIINYKVNIFYLQYKIKN